MEIGKERYTTNEGADAITALERLAAACAPSHTDWLAYWRGNNYVFHHPFLTCSELEGMDATNAVCAIGKKNFGNAGALLSRAGIGTLGALAAGLRTGLPEIPGMGQKKWSELFGTIVELVRDLRSGEVSLEWLAAKYPIGGESPGYAEQDEARFALHEATKSLDIGVLHLGQKTETLKAHNINTVGDAASAISSMLSFSGVGRTTVGAVEERLENLASAQITEGGVDWVRYCDGIGVPLLPSAGDPVDGNDLVRQLGQSIGEIGDKLDDKVLKLIIERRLSKLPHERATLEDIGAARDVNLTRERIRQIESKFLSSLVAALLNDDYSHLDVHFRSKFAGFWKAAADRFTGSEEVSHGVLIDGLAEAWNVDRALLTEHLPFIVTVITGDVPTGRSLGDGAKLGLRLIDLPAAVASIPVRMLKIGKSASTLETYGLDTVGKLVEAVRTGAVSRSSGGHFRNAIDHLVHVSDNIAETGEFDWGGYLANTGIPILPPVPSVTPTAFLQNLTSTISALLETTPPTSRSPVIFARRTCHPVESRISTEALAKELGTHGSSIKREETEMLRFVNSVLVEGNLAIAKAHVQDDFLANWRTALASLEEADGNLDKFRLNLMREWRLKQEVVDPAFPTLVAVLTGYPYKRLGRYTKLATARPQQVAPLPVIPVEDQDLPERIVLRGFRRLH